jgi:hypothetical protein
MPQNCEAVGFVQVALDEYWRIIGLIPPDPEEVKSYSTPASFS